VNVFLRLFLALTVAVLTIFFPACSSDDDNGTNSTIKVPGSTLDLNYSIFRNIALSLTDASNAGRIQDLLDLY
jgi:hypothetical protein